MLPLSGLGKKRRYWKTAVKGLILAYYISNIIQLRKNIPYLGLENQRRYWGQAVNGGAVFGGGAVI